MRQSILLLLLLLSLGFSSSGQDALNMTLLGQLTYDENLNDIWADVHNGREYAFVGTVDGLSIVDLSDPANPFEVSFTPGPNTVWRDPFYYNGHAYCVNEDSEGLSIIDMSALPPPGVAPSVFNLPVTYYTGNLYPFTTGHTTSVDESGHAYIYGSDYGVGGVIILDLSQDPENPIELGVWNQYYVHDGFARGDTLWTACINNGFAARLDISNPASPQLITTWNTPSNFTHNIWPTDDNTVVFTTDEVSSAYITAYDVTDLTNIQELDRIQHPLSEGVIPHNVYYQNDYLISSQYRDGVAIHDATDPSNLILTGYYDTSPLSGGGFNSVWGVWPYLPSGIIVASDIEGGLFIFDPQYTRAARIEGTVTNSNTGVPLSGVSVEVVSTSIQENTAAFGTYASGLAQGGTFDVTFLKGGFLPQTISNVALVNGQTTVLDVQLVPDVPFTLQVTVTEEGTGNPIGGSDVTFVNALFDISATTNGDGAIEDDTFYEGTYDVTVGRWGYVTECTTVTIDELNNGLSFSLTKQYFDDFAIDLGWQVSGSATSGIWTREAPIATDYQGVAANPGSDSEQGCGDFAFVTGNGGMPVNIDDVDDGNTVLTSPSMDLTTVIGPLVKFSYWFFTGGGNDPSNDELIVKVSNGTDIVTLASLPTTNQVWTDWQLFLPGFIDITDNMKVEFHIADTPPGHLVEAGIDQFSVDISGGVGENAMQPRVVVYPNPTVSGTFQVMVPKAFHTASARILDISGKVISPEMTLTQNLTSINTPANSGIYLVELLIDGQRTVKRLAVHR
jgi:choice-of-anchor B domain-containing protein